MKRLIDLVISGVALLVLSPLILLIALLVRSQLGSPVFFRQVRPGHHAKPFEMIKFRTMLNVKGVDGIPVTDGDRLTRLGNFLRATSLDELPGLWNVLRNDMSLVGPRPLAMAYLPLFSEDQMRRHEVKPGITGWAQVNGRNAVSWTRRFQMDVWYVDNRSIWLDFRILARTVKIVMRREGVMSGGQHEVTSFDGHN